MSLLRISLTVSQKNNHFKDNYSSLTGEVKHKSVRLSLDIKQHLTNLNSRNEKVTNI